MMGIGTSAILIPPSLFGTEVDKSTIWAPSEGVTLCGNPVVYRKPLSTKVAPVSLGYRNNLLQSNKRCQQWVQPGTRSESRTIARINKQEMSITEYRVVCGHGKGEDPIADAHIIFTRAAAKIQQQLAQDAIVALKALPERRRLGAQIMTIIHSPIHARPKLDAWEGFDVFCEASVRADIGNQYGAWHLRVPKVDLSTYEMYSNTGKYPIDVPAALDFGMLLKAGTAYMGSPEYRVTQRANNARLHSLIRLS